MMMFFLVVAGCLGPGTPTSPPTREPTVLPTQSAEPIRVGLPFGAEQPIAQFNGTVTLVASESDHDGSGMLMGVPTGTLELHRDGEITRIDFQSNQVFEAWDTRMAVFGMGGSLELSIFPEGASIEP